MAVRAFPSNVQVARKQGRIRRHYVVYEALVHQLLLVIASSLLLNAACFFLFDGVGQFVESVGTFPLKQLKSEMTESSIVFFLAPLTVGLFKLVVIALLMYQSFNSGVSIRLGTVSSISIIVLSALAAIGGGIIAYDLYRFPDDSLGTVNSLINIYAYIMYYGFSRPNSSYELAGTMSQIMHRINRKLQCCGLHHPLDHYNMNRLSWQEDPKSLTQFALSQEWMTNCSQKAPPTFTCTVPTFCCKKNETDCNTLRIGGTFEVKPGSSLFWTRPCDSAIAILARNQMIIVTVASLVSCLLAVGYLLRLCVWKQNQGGGQKKVA